MKTISIYMHLTGVMTALLLLFSCSAKEEPVKQRDAIGLDVDIPATRATIFDSPASLLNPVIGGGDMTVSAYVAGNSSNAGKCHIDNVRVNYFTDARDWRFTDENGIFVKYYWPLGEKLNFFAHMPYIASEGAVSNISYVYGKGPSFEYTLPMNNQESLREFIYAYTENQDINTQNADPADPGVKLVFKHPFAGLYFELGQSYRMKLHSITITGIRYAGKYEYDNGWTMIPDPDTDDLTLLIEKDIPDPINYNSPIGGPYIVAPQALEEGSKLIVRYTRLDGNPEDVETYVKALSPIWEAGHKYTYTINLGKTEEEILFKVKVEKWDVIDYKNEITVE